ncbi:MAG: hypothetical protein ACFB10_24800 [Salibacteraceae bacterium]
MTIQQKIQKQFSEIFLHVDFKRVSDHSGIISTHELKVQYPRVVFDGVSKTLVITRHHHELMTKNVQKEKFIIEETTLQVGHLDDAFTLYPINIDDAPDFCELFLRSSSNRIQKKEQIWYRIPPEKIFLPMGKINLPKFSSGFLSCTGNSGPLPISIEKDTTHDWKLEDTLKRIRESRIIVDNRRTELIGLMKEWSKT